MKYCTKCGKKIKEGNEYCESCKNNKSNRVNYKLVLVILGVLLLIGVIFLVNNSSQSNRTTNQGYPQQNHYNAPTNNNPTTQTLTISLSDARQIVLNKGEIELVQPYGYSTQIIDSYVENGNWIIKVKYWMANCNDCTTGDKNGWFIIYTIDGQNGKVLNQQKEYP